MMMEINYKDKFFNEAEHNIINQYCIGASYQYGETDNDGTPCTGLIHNIPETSFVYKLFRKKLSDEYKEVTNDMKLYRMYINCFAPSENPYFHTDGEEGITFLYYPNMNWDLQEGGETQFYINDDIYGITPVPNRIVIFSANIKHRATTFRNNHRFTVAIKYA